MAKKGVDTTYAGESINNSQYPIIFLKPHTPIHNDVETSGLITEEEEDYRGNISNCSRWK